MVIGTIEERLARLEEKVARLTGEYTEGQIIIESSPTPFLPVAPLQPGPRTLEERMQAWQNRSPEEIEAARAELELTVRKARPLPPGKTLEDVIVGQIPGDETEEEITALLKDS